MLVSQRYSMYANVVWLVDGIDDFAIVGVVGHKVEAVSVEKEDAHVALLFADEVEITLLDVV